MEFIKPKSLNGAQLKNELLAAGIKVEIIEDLANGKIAFEISESEINQANQIVNNHIGVDSVLSLEDKLASIGLNIDELKAALK